MRTTPSENDCDCLRADCTVCFNRRAPLATQPVHRVIELMHPNGEKATQEELEKITRGEKVEIKRLMPCGLCDKQHPEGTPCLAKTVSEWVPPKKSEPLPSEAAERKGIPIATGFIDYFPDAIADVARLSKIGNDQHNAGKPLHWDRSKSGDESDALMRHFLQRGTLDTDGVRHSAKVAWRALAMLQKEIEKVREGV